MLAARKAFSDRLREINVPRSAAYEESKDLRLARLMARIKVQLTKIAPHCVPKQVNPL